MPTCPLASLVAGESRPRLGNEAVQRSLTCSEPSPQGTLKMTRQPIQRFVVQRRAGGSFSWEEKYIKTGLSLLAKNK